MACTPPCVIETVLVVGNLMTQLWNSPLKDFLKDLLKKPLFPKLNITPQELVAARTRRSFIESQHPKPYHLFNKT
jgi:hypothetical protein